MPMVNLGGVLTKPSNYSAWLSPAVGGTAVDTALSYGTKVQQQVGVALANSGLKRDRTFVTTKVPCCPDGAPSHMWFSCDDPDGKNTTLALERDLHELGLDAVDLMLVHWPCSTMEETIKTYRALEAFHAAGKARAIGVSNFNVSQLRQLLAAATVPPAVNQCEFSIGNHDDDALDFCKAHNITYEAYSPLGGLSHVDVLGDADVQAIARRHNKSAAQVALRWVVQQGVPFVTAAMNPTFMVEDLDLFDFELGGDEMDTLAAK